MFCSVCFESVISKKNIKQISGKKKCATQNQISPGSPLSTRPKKVKCSPDCNIATVDLHLGLIPDWLPHWVRHWDLTSKSRLYCNLSVLLHSWLLVLLCGYRLATVTLCCCVTTLKNIVYDFTLGLCCSKDAAAARGLNLERIHSFQWCVEWHCTHFC